MLLGGFMFIADFVVARLDSRFKWLPSPQWLVVAATVVVLFAHFLYVQVLGENAYLSRTVEAQKNRKAIDTGLYGIQCMHLEYCCFVHAFGA